MRQPHQPEQVQLIVAPHHEYHFFRGWRQFMVLFTLSAIQMMSQKLFWWFIGAMFVLAIFQTISLRRKQRKVLSQPTGAARLRCIGNHDELDQLRNLEPEFFEPFIVQSSPFQMPNGVKKIPRKRTAYFMTTMGVVVFIFSGAGFPTSWTMGLLSIMYLTIFFITFHAVPIYHRVSPGQLELLTSSPLREGLTLKKRLPLNRATIICQCGGDVIIQVPGEEAERIFLTDFSQEDESEFIEALFRAAISNHRAPDLPVNELTG